MGRGASALMVVAALALGACGSSHQFAVVPEAAGVGDSETIFVGSIRDLTETDFLGPGRSETPFRGVFTVSVPPEREPGSLPIPRRHETPDPQQHFLVSDARAYADRTAFRQALTAALRPDPNAIIFVHGFNTSFTGGLLRQAQFTHDFDLPGVAVHFSWPSAGNPAGYTYDHDSMLFSRSALEQLIEDVHASGAETVVMVAHSMGAMLTIETLRQMSIRAGGGDRTGIDGVVLFSPDVDVDLFRQQAMDSGDLPQPFVIFTSQRDPALRLSSLLTGQQGRLGNLADTTELADLPVIILDVTGFDTDAANRHFTAVSSPLLMSILAQVGAMDTAFDTDRSGRPGLIPGSVILLQRATEVILSPGLLLD